MRGRTHWLIVLATLLVAGSVPADEELTKTAQARDASVGSGFSFSPSQTYDVVFSVHPDESNQLSGVRLSGVTELSGKPFLQFDVLLRNQTVEGLIDLASVTAILPTGKLLTSVSELQLERRPAVPDRLREIRAETVRETVREVPVPPMPGPRD